MLNVMKHYCSTGVIDATTNDLIVKLQRIQGRALRICKYDKMYIKTSVTELHNHFRIELLVDRRFKQLLLLMFKQSKNIGTLVDDDNRRTRNDNKVKIGTVNYKFKSTQKSPWYRGVWEWDDLPAATQKLEKKGEFQNKIRLKKPRPHLV